MTDAEFYEQEVKKTHPKAFLRSRVVIDFGYQVRTPFLKIFSKPLGRVSFVKELAWQDAYEKIQKKITTN